MSFKKIIKIVLGLIATIIIGAIGSGVWEKLLSPFLSFLSSEISQFFSSISTSYANNIYSKMSSLDGTSNLNDAHWVFLLIFFFFLFLYSASKNKHKFIIGEFVETHNEMFSSWAGIIFTGSMLVGTVLMMSMDKEIYKLRSQTLEHIEIIRPYINENEYLLIRSEFFQIKTEKSFNDLKQKIKDVSLKNKLAL
jgi:hypothetical protein